MYKIWWSSWILFVRRKQLHHIRKEEWMNCDLWMVYSYVARVSKNMLDRKERELFTHWRLVGIFLFLDFPGAIVKRIWTTSLIVGLESGSHCKHSLAKWAIICISSSGNFPLRTGSGNSETTSSLSRRRLVACNHR